MTVEELSERLGVSAPTIRRDLSSLEAEGLLRRTHGGATVVRPVHYEAFAYDSSYLEQEGLHARRSAASAWPLPIWWATGRRSA